MNDPSLLMLSPIIITSAKWSKKLCKVLIAYFFRIVQICPKFVQNWSNWSNLVQYWLKLDQIHLNFICFYISGKRIAKVVGISMECDKMIEDYETFTSDLLKWIETKIAELGTRDFANSLRGVQVSFRFRPFCKKNH